jgi:hypothetical protein
MSSKIYEFEVTQHHFATLRIRAESLEDAEAALNEAHTWEDVRWRAQQLRDWSIDHISTEDDGKLYDVDYTEEIVTGEANGFGILNIVNIPEGARLHIKGRLGMSISTYNSGRWPQEEQARLSLPYDVYQWSLEISGNLVTCGESLVSDELVLLDMSDGK